MRAKEIVNEFLKGSYVAKVILTTESRNLVEALLKDKEVITLLLDSINSDEPLLLESIGKILSMMLRYFNNTKFDNIDKIIPKLELIVSKIDIYSISEFIISLLTHDTYQNCETMKLLCENNVVHFIFQQYLKEPTASVPRVVREIVVWKHSFNVGIVGEVFVDFCNVDPLLGDVYKLIFDEKLVNGIEMIGNLLTLSTSNEECCMIPSSGLPSIYRCLIPYYSEIGNILNIKNEKNPNKIVIGELRIQTVYLILSLVVSNYKEVINSIIQSGIIPSLIVCYL